MQLDALVDAFLYISTRVYDSYQLSKPGYCFMGCNLTFLWLFLVGKEFNIITNTRIIFQVHEIPKKTASYIYNCILLILLYD